MSKPRGVLVAGNWKMNHGPAATRGFLETLGKLEFPSAIVQRASRGRALQGAILVPAVSLEAARSVIDAQGWSDVLQVGAQNAHFEASGAFTGELSGPLLKEIGVNLALVGHSERRQYFGETDESAGKRTASLLSQGFEVILCVGENRSERKTGRTKAVLSKQLTEAFQAAQSWMTSRGLELTPTHWARLAIAYEPVWAIGTGLTASPEQAQDAHLFIRTWLEKSAKTAGFPLPPAQTTAILYGGSVTPDNFSGLLACPDVDGGLVGGASLKPESFLKLIEAAAQVI
ncbi:MAG: triose-phosphate isomerase [Bdellovibrionales bacterium]|nr:triose-phosphate isomerase [Bdellovibrionales bacterium]